MLIKSGRCGCVDDTQAPHQLYVTIFYLGLELYDSLLAQTFIEPQGLV